MPANENQRLVVGAVLLAAVGAAAFAIVLRFPFVYDDHWTIVENRWLEAPFSTLLAAAADGTAQARGIPDATRPAMIASLWLDRHVFGLHPLGYHLHSLVLYAAACGAAGWTAFALSRDEIVALLAGLLFALSPVHAEAVSAVNYREDLIAGIGVMVPLAWLFGPRSRTSMSGILAVGACFLWGLLGKESAAALVPLAVALILVQRVDRDFWHAREFGLFVLASALILWLNWRLALAALGDGIPRAPAATLSTSFFDSCRYMTRSLEATLWPFGSAPEYDVLPPASAWWVLGPVSILIAVVALARRGEPRAIAAGLCIATLAPIMASPSFGPINPWADRYLFVGVLGGGLVWGELGARIGRWIPARVRLPLLVAACAGAAAMCLHSSRAWASERAVWTAAVQSAPRSPRAWAALSRVERLDGNLAAADRDIERALEIDATSAPARTTQIYNLLAHGDAVSARRELARLDRLGVGDAPGLSRARFCAAQGVANPPQCARGGQ